MIPTEVDQAEARIILQKSIDNYTRLIENHRAGGNEGVVICLSRVREELQKLLDKCQNGVKE